MIPDDMTPGAIYGAACDSALLGDAESALHGLEQAIAFGWADPRWMEEDSDLSSVRALPRHQELLKQARRRAEQHGETGRLFLPLDEIIPLGDGGFHAFLPSEAMNRLALLIPAIDVCRERALVLLQEAAEAAHRTDEEGCIGRVIGTGGTLGEKDRYAWFTVVSFKPAANPHP